MANQSLWTELTQWQRGEEKEHEDAHPHIPGALVIDFFAVKILGEQQESPTVTSRSIVHLRVLIPNPNR